MIQFLLLVALGAVVAFIVDDTNRRITNAQEERGKRKETAERERQSAIEIVTTLLNRLGAIYREVKSERYSLRLIPEADLTKRRYIEMIQALHADKQALEILWQDIQTNARWLPELTSIWPRVEEMETYLRPIENEAERVRETKESDFSVASQGEFMAFKAKWETGESSFPKFRKLHHEARAGLIDVLASLRGVRMQASSSKTAPPGSFDISDL